jgi:hypothetical protein
VCFRSRHIRWENNRKPVAANKSEAAKGTAGKAEKDKDALLRLLQNSDMAKPENDCRKPVSRI